MSTQINEIIAKVLQAMYTSLSLIKKLLFYVIKFLIEQKSLKIIF